MISVIAKPACSPGARDRMSVAAEALDSFAAISACTSAAPCDDADDIVHEMRAEAAVTSIVTDDARTPASSAITAARDSLTSMV